LKRKKEQEQVEEEKKARIDYRRTLLRIIRIHRYRVVVVVFVVDKNGLVLLLKLVIFSM
jgi:uncharacterized protein YnzC (UPF0291/DUF896 family)